MTGRQADIYSILYVLIFSCVIAMFPGMIVMIMRHTFSSEYTRRFAKIQNCACTCSKWTVSTFFLCLSLNAFKILLETKSACFYFVLVTNWTIPVVVQTLLRTVFFFQLDCNSSFSSVLVKFLFCQYWSLLINLVLKSIKKICLNKNLFLGLSSKVQYIKLCHINQRLSLPYLLSFKAKRWLRQN